MKTEDQKKAQRITVTLSQADADWLTDHLGDYWQFGYNGIEEVDYFMPMLTTYKALVDAGAAPYQNEPVKAVSE